MSVSFSYLFITFCAMCFSHCPLMCGAFSSALPHAWAYHLARAAGYCALSICAQSFGAALSVKFAAPILFFAGCFLLLLSCALAFRGALLKFFESARLASKISALMLLAFRRRSVFFVFIAGALNSCLPCGVVYSLLALSFSAASIFHALAFALVLAFCSSLSLLCARVLLRAAAWRFVAPILLAAQGGYLALKGVMLYG